MKKSELKSLIQEVLKEEQPGRHLKSNIDTTWNSDEDMKNDLLYMIDDIADINGEDALSAEISIFEELIDHCNGLIFDAKKFKRI